MAVETGHFVHSGLSISLHKKKNGVDDIDGITNNPAVFIKRSGTCFYDLAGQLLRVRRETSMNDLILFLDLFFFLISSRLE